MRLLADMQELLHAHNTAEDMQCLLCKNAHSDMYGYACLGAVKGSTVHEKSHASHV